VDSILTYGAGIWGLSNFQSRDSIQIRTMPIFLRVNRFTAKPAICGDMGWLTALTNRQICALRSK
jgi:hypothetical protein